jgi:hypothetical protein
MLLLGKNFDLNASSGKSPGVFHIFLWLVMQPTETNYITVCFFGGRVLWR